MSRARVGLAVLLAALVAAPAARAAPPPLPPPNLTEERAKTIWAPFAKLPDAAFYLYVPVGYGGKAKAICKKANIQVYGFRTWRYVPQGIEINDVSEPPDVMSKLMPPIVRKLLRGM